MIYINRFIYISILLFSQLVAAEDGSVSCPIDPESSALSNLILSIEKINEFELEKISECADKQRLFLEQIETIMENATKKASDALAKGEVQKLSLIEMTNLKQKSTYLTSLKTKLHYRATDYSYIIVQTLKAKREMDEMKQKNESTLAYANEKKIFFLNLSQEVDKGIAFVIKETKQYGIEFPKFQGCQTK